MTSQWLDEAMTIAARAMMVLDELGSYNFIKEMDEFDKLFEQATIGQLTSRSGLDELLAEVGVVGLRSVDAMYQWSKAFEHRTHPEVEFVSWEQMKDVHLVTVNGSDRKPEWFVVAGCPALSGEYLYRIDLGREAVAFTARFLVSPVSVIPSLAEIVARYTSAVKIARGDYLLQNRLGRTLLYFTAGLGALVRDAKAEEFQQCA